MNSTTIEQLTRPEIIKQIREEWGNSEETEKLIAYIKELWETVDLLRKQFSEERMQKVINTPASIMLSIDST